MRVIAGSARRLLLKAPKGLETRPTTDKIKETLFNILVNVFESDIYSNINKKYDYIITNPPIRVGKEILYKILFEAEKYLKENGQMFLVINKNQGAKSLYKDLEEKYKVDILVKNKGFYVIQCEKR